MRGLGGLLTAALLGGCGRPAAAPPEKLERVVSIVPSVTEMLFAVGAGDQVVGVTRFCAYPPEAAAREKVGDIQVSLEKVLALRPDAVFSSASLAGAANAALERAGLHVIPVDAESFEEIAEQLRRLGRRTGHAGKGEDQARRLLERIRRVEERVRGRPAPTVYFESTADPIWTAGPDSYAGDAIRRAGGRNIMTDLPRPWSPVSWELILKRDPDVLLIAHDQKSLVEARPGWRDLKAVRGGRVHYVPKEAFYFPTPRLADGLELAAKVLHGAD